jgi:hypothetical protein
MSHTPISSRNWRTSTASGGSNCVQVGSNNDMVVVGDSKNPDQVLSYTRQEWAAFLEGAKRGEFDEFAAAETAPGRLN